MDKGNFALESFKNIQELIRFIDQKSGAVFVISGLALTAFIEFAKELKFVSFNESSFVGIICFLAGLFSVLSLLAVIWISIFKVLKPRLAKNYSETDHSLFYFEHLSKNVKDQIEEQYKNLTDDVMIRQLIDQQFEVSQILEQKTKYLSLCFNFLFISIISLVLFILTSTSI